MRPPRSASRLIRTLPIEISSRTRLSAAGPYFNETSIEELVGVDPGARAWSGRSWRPPGGRLLQHHRRQERRWRATRRADLQRGVPVVRARGGGRPRAPARLAAGQHPRRNDLNRAGRGPRAYQALQEKFGLSPGGGEPGPNEQAHRGHQLAPPAEDCPRRFARAAARRASRLAAGQARAAPTLPTTEEQIDLALRVTVTRGCRRAAWALHAAKRRRLQPEAGQAGPSTPPRRRGEASPGAYRPGGRSARRGRGDLRIPCPQ